MICFPNAKINIGLHIVSRREDGYHNLETLFYPIGLKDALEIIPSGEPQNHFGETSSHFGETSNHFGETPASYRFFQSGLPIDGNTEDNLVVKALRLIAREKRVPPIDIHLLKKIPSGAGLGGGSSNAAFMLHLLNDTFGFRYSDRELTRLAATLGADCAFFIGNQPALATGMGEILDPVELDLSGYFMLLVKPEAKISTKEAYAMVTPKQPEQPLKAIIQKPVTEWKEHLKNDFEPAIFKKYPEVSRIKQQLYELGAVYASMSGSGSSVYALFEKEPDWQSTFSTYFTWSNKPL